MIAAEIANLRELALTYEHGCTEPSRQLARDMARQANNDVLDSMGFSPAGVYGAPGLTMKRMKAAINEMHHRMEWYRAREEIARKHSVLLLIPPWEEHKIEWKPMTFDKPEIPAWKRWRILSYG